MNKVKLSDMKSPKLCVVHHRAEEASSSTRSVHDISFSSMFEFLMNLIASVRGQQPSGRVVAGTMEALIREGSVYLVLPNNESLRMFVSEDCGDNINDYPWPKVTGQFRVLSFDEADHLADVLDLIDKSRDETKPKKKAVFTMNPLPAALMNALFSPNNKAQPMTDEQILEEQAKLLSEAYGIKDPEAAIREYFHQQAADRQKNDRFSAFSSFFASNPGFNEKERDMIYGRFVEPRIPKHINYPCKLVSFPDLIGGLKNKGSTLHSMLKQNAEPKPSALTEKPFRLMIQTSFYTATKGLIDHDVFSVRSVSLEKAVAALHNMAKGKAIYFDKEVLLHEAAKMIAANLSEVRKHNKKGTSGLFTTFIDGEQWGKNCATYKGFTNNPDGGYHMRVAMFLTVNPIEKL